MSIALLLAALAGAAELQCPKCPVLDCRPNTDTIRRSGTKGLINPLLDVEPSLEFSELRPFKHKIQDLIDEQKSSGAVTHVSVYFRDLNNGPLFGIDEKERFAPASLLKVPIMMAVLKRAEADPAFLKARAEYDPKSYGIPFTSTDTLRQGEVYTVDQLLRAMVVNSDNASAFLLKTMVGAGAIDEVFEDLGLAIPDVRSPDDYMTVREYGTFFRILYNASYLNRALSQKALELLAASTYKEGLPSGVAPGMVVAHKFGERFTVNEQMRQLHDCGIVYFPPRPYIICIMTRGVSFPNQLGVIGKISRLVYKEVESSERDR